MKIQQSNGLPPAIEPAGHSPGTRPPQGPSPGAADSVRLSELGRGLASTDAAESSFDPAKVEAVKAAMANGTLRVDTAKVADALIASVAGLLGRRGP